MDYFGRTAGLTARNDDFVFRPHVDQLTISGIWADARAALEHLHSSVSVQGKAFVTGFCIGGGLVLQTATEDFGLAGHIAFYAGLGRTWEPAKGTVLEAARFITGPVLGLFGGADTAIPVDQVDVLDKTLDGTGVMHDIKIYDGAPHSFFDRQAAQYAEASADAWEKILGFITARSA
jgi:carboxymethylenebutenolidase